MSMMADVQMLTQEQNQLLVPMSRKSLFGADSLGACTIQHDEFVNYRKCTDLQVSYVFFIFGHFQ
jgi:hypothetical protein